MSLNLYTNKDDIRIPFERYNDKFFIGMQLKDDAFVRMLLSEIDDCEYSSKTAAFSRKFNMLIPKDSLSTGCKTLLNIYMNPDMCFDMSECGYNAINLLGKFKSGNAYLRNPVFAVFTDEEDVCDIILDGRHFDKLTDIIDYVINEVDKDV